MVSVKERTVTYAAAALIVLAWLMWRHKLPVVHVDSRSLVDDQYDPFIHWRMQDPLEYFRPHPVSIGPNCMPRILQAAPLGLALSAPEVDCASYPQ